MPTEWDPNGQVTAVAIYTYDEQQWLVADTPAGRNLLKNLKKQVLVKGRAEKTENSNRVWVDSFRVEAFGEGA